MYRRTLNPDEYEICEIEKGLFGLGNLIALDHTYQEELLSLADDIRGYLEKAQAARPINYWIEAAPGSGKSYLVKQISKSLEQSSGQNRIQYEYVNVTTIQTPSEIFNMFSRIQSINIEDKLPVVFFDEMDSELANSETLFKYFLMPMYDGEYIQDGVRHSLGKAVLFFAASRLIPELFIGKKEKTEDLKSQRIDYKVWSDNLKQSRVKAMYSSPPSPDYKPPLKLRDFIDRMDKVVAIPPLSVWPNNDTKLSSKQAEYIAASLIWKHMPSTVFVHKSVMWLVQNNLLSNPSKRIVESVILRSSTPKTGFLTIDHLPPEFVKANEEKLNKHQDRIEQQKKWVKLIKKGNDRIVLSDLIPK